MDEPVDSDSVLGRLERELPDALAFAHASAEHDEPTVIALRDGPLRALRNQCKHYGDTGRHWTSSVSGPGGAG